METMAAGTESSTTDEGKRGPILAATDATKQSEGALAVARSLAEAWGSTVRTVTVQRPLVLTVPEERLLLERDITKELARDLKDRARSQSADISGESAGPALPDPEIYAGEPERVITRISSEQHAQLMVVGIGRHDVIDRIFGSETALKVARLSRVPVLAVPAEVRGVPRSAVVGVDFGDPSLHAAQSALHLLAAGGVLHLVHVIPRGRLLVDPWISDEEYDELVRHRFVRFRALLAVPPNVIVKEDSCTGGDIAKELIRYTERQQADLIAAGSHGHGFVSRLWLGSVTTALLRAAKSAVLIVPPESTASSAASLADGTLHIEPSHWSTVLADFTRTNVGRPTRLETDDPEIGAQAQEWDYPLLGVSFDPHDERLEIMVGGEGAGEPHLSHRIAGVRSLDVLTDKDGADVALRAQHGDGQTLLTFVSPRDHRNA